eukprot:2103103-Heterocapsa_arctica.AAC.1
MRKGSAPRLMIKKELSHATLDWGSNKERAAAPAMEDWFEIGKDIGSTKGGDGCDKGSGEGRTKRGGDERRGDAERCAATSD